MGGRCRFIYHSRFVFGSSAGIEFSLSSGYIAQQRTGAHHAREARLPPRLRGRMLADAPMLGGTPREILQDVAWADWSPDGQLAVVHRVNGRDHLEFPIGKVLTKPAVPSATSAFRPVETGSLSSITPSNGTTAIRFASPILAETKLRCRPTGDGNTVWHGLRSAMKCGSVPWKKDRAIVLSGQ